MDNANEEYTVSSELYAEFNYATTSTPTINKNNKVSRFPFSYPPKNIEIDADGDLILQRKPKEQSFIEIEHSQSTTLGFVGLQVWRGALLLADWLLHEGDNLPLGTKILELGSGTGLTSIVASMFAPVICTDVNIGEIIPLIKNNIRINNNIVQFAVNVMEIDFTRADLSTEILDVLPDIQIVLAADVVYDDDLTASFVKTLEMISSYPPKRKIYVALEKRYVFTIADCDTVAPCYEYFLECLKKMRFAIVKEVPLDFPRYFQYERVKELVLLEITCTH